MGLQLILGASGAGKSHFLYQNIINESIEHKDRNYIVIVPEQFTMQTQKDLVTMHPCHGVLNIDILSFLRLAYRVFEETNTTKRLVLEDTGKSMMLRKVIADLNNELFLFGNNVRKPGFIAELKSFLSELYQYGIGVDDLEKMVQKVENKPMLASKLKDMVTIYKGFQEQISETYITAEEILEVLGEVIGESQIIKESVICFDGFTGFTPVQYKLISKLMKLCKAVIVTVTIDERENLYQLQDEFQLFHLSKKTIYKLKELAKEEGVPVENPVYVRQGKVPYRFRDSSALQSLEHNLFRYPYSAYQEEQEDVKILVAKDPAAEVAFTLKEIERLVRDEGYRYKDIAIVTGDLESYGKIIQKQYAKYQVPCFIDLKKEVRHNPFIEFIRSLLELVIKDFHYEVVFRFLRNAFSDIQQEQVDELENYVLALGIRGFTNWKKEWKRVYRSKKEVNLEELNRIREQFVKQIEAVTVVLKDKKSSIKDMTIALYQCFCAYRIEEKLEWKRERFTEQGEMMLAKEYKQLYPLVMELMDKLVELLGDEIVPLKEYKQLLESGLEEIKVGLIPPGIDQIVVGDIERTRLKDIKALFFIGVNDGIVPKSSNQGGIISDLEREILTENEMEIAPTSRQNTFIEQFYLYLNLTKPTNKLYLSYSKIGVGGKSLRASYLIGKMKQLFPKLQTIDLEKVCSEEEVEHIIGADKGLTYLIKGLREYDGEMPEIWKELFHWYKEQEKNLILVKKLVEGACYNNEELEISRTVARALYGNELSNSVTRLEKYAACAYAHFLSYGLELQERQIYQLAAPDIGTIFHATMELFAKKLEKSPYDWGTIEQEQRDQLVTESVKEAVLDYNNTVFFSTKRNEYMVKRVERIAKRTVWALCEHVKAGDFVPKGFELQFSKMDHLSTTSIELEHQTVMGLQGRIDRVDEMEKEQEVYVRVVDYKSGSTTLDLNKMYYGLQLQLVVYLSAALELEQKTHPEKIVIPAGIFYYNIDDPIVAKQLDYQRMKEEHGHSEEWMQELKENILKELKLDGYVNKKEEVIVGMDHSFRQEEEGLKRGIQSNIIPVETTKDGVIGKRSSTISRHQFGQLQTFVMEKVKEYGNQIIGGDVSLTPFKMGEKTACDYCKFLGVCGFDQNLPGNRYRKLKKLSKEEVWNEIQQEEEEE